MNLKVIKLFKSEKGSGLVLALMVLLVLSVLGSMLGVVTVGSYRLGDVNQDSMSAYYIAEAGANMAYEEIRSRVMDAYDESENPSSFFNIIDNPFDGTDTVTYKEEFEPQFEIQPTAQIELTGELPTNNTKNYTVISKGEVNGKNRAVEKAFRVTWHDKKIEGGFPYIPTGASAIVKNKIKLKNGYITGDIYLDSKSNNSFEISNAGNTGFDILYTSYPNNLNDIYKGSGGGYENNIGQTKRMDISIPWTEYYQVVESLPYPSYNDYSLIEEPEVVKNESEKYHYTRNGNIYIDNYLVNNIVLELPENKQANKLIFGSNYKLKIKTNNQTVNLVVNELDISTGHIEIVDNGTLNLFVLDQLNIGSGSTINKNGNHKNFNLFYGGDQKLTIAGNQHIKGGIHLSKADLDLTASGNISGPILSNGSNITISGGSNNDILIFAPKANISLSGSGTINGVVVANHLELSGNPKINYRNYNFGNIPKSFYLTQDSTIASGLEGLISTQPTIEKK